MKRCPSCNSKVTKNGPNKKGEQVYRCKSCRKTTTNPVLIEDIRQFNDIMLSEIREKKESRQDRLRQTAAATEIEFLRTQLDNYESLHRQSETHEIVPTKSSGTSESVAIMQWADWHCEEIVHPDSVNGLNEFNPQIAIKRVDALANGAVKLTRIFQKDTHISEYVIQLGGDFITGNIHEENAEVCSEPPVDAISTAQSLLRSAIDFLLNHTKLNITFICNVGNHARITKKTHIASEAGNSLETGLYKTLSSIYESEKRVKFIIKPSSFIFYEIYNNHMRFFHGHQVRYNNGVGTFAVPLYRKIANLNRTQRADYNFMNHFHQSNFFSEVASNGSLIGYNKFAMDHGFRYELPQQNYCLFNKKWEVLTMKSPIILER